MGSQKKLIENPAKSVGNDNGKKCELVAGSEWGAPPPPQPPLEVLSPSERGGRVQPPVVRKVVWVKRLMGKSAEREKTLVDLTP